MNLGTVGFLMNRYRSPAKLGERLHKARAFDIAPLRMEAIGQKGERHVASARSTKSRCCAKRARPPRSR